MRLRSQLHASQQVPTKDSRLVAFRNELTLVLRFLERDEAHREVRSILAGIAFAGPFICVNTRLLKNFLGRCKSSINGGFQQMGYVALKTKAKARNCILTVMRTLTSDHVLLRQWTVRGASGAADSCFVSSFPVQLLPEIAPSDLLIDSSLVPLTTALQARLEAPRAPPVASAFSAVEESEWPSARQVEPVEACQPAWGAALPVGRSVAEPIDVDNDWVRMMNEWSAL
jgi:hypothetical protein